MRERWLGLPLCNGSPDPAPLTACRPAGTSPNLDWAPWHLSQVEAAALTIVHVLRFRAELLAETLPPETVAGQPLCMAQYERMYNSCRVPGEECDSIETFAHDKRHVAVLRNNVILSVEVLDEAGRIKPVHDIIRQLEDCIELSSSRALERTAGVRHALPSPVPLLSCPPTCCSL